MENWYNDIINGNIGNDVLDGGEGEDVITGGEGFDLILLVVKASKKWIRCRYFIWQ